MPKTCLVAAQGQRKDSAKSKIGFERDSGDLDHDIDDGLMQLLLVCPA